ncbi:MAG: hypothetical protein CSA79_00640 [Thiothrix nivea]|nr:MAG: hypothetical protein CSA79_00640 [Thiothrix nivea]
MPDARWSLQFVIIALCLFVLGVVLGWLVAQRKGRKIEQRLLDELTGLRVNYSYIREDAHELRVQLKQAEAKNNRLAKLLDSTSGYDRFLKVRTELETARKGIQALKSMLGRLENEKFVLKETVRRYHRQQITRSPLHLLGPDSGQLPALNDGHDNLQHITGISAQLEHKLHSMGIMSFRQLAECTPAQLQSIQNLVGDEQPLPLHDWVKAARQLFLEKYCNSENDANVFAEQPLLQSVVSGKLH